MINIEQFINVIHSAVISANETLKQENLNLVRDYFEDTGEVEEMQDSLDDALEQVEEALKHTRPTKAMLDSVKEAFVNAKESLQDEGKTQRKAKSPSCLRAKTVTLQYPDQTSKGVVMRNVNVPLIALMPVSLPQVSEVKFKTNLEIMVDKDDLKIDFPMKGQNMKTEGLSVDDQPTNTSIEITITPQENAEGLKRLIEGYERTLRSQIPG